MHSRRIPWMVCIVLCISAWPVFAGLNCWTSDQPDGGNVHTIVFHPTQPGVVFAANTVGLFRSTDGGQTWASFGTGLSVLRPNRLFFAPENPDIMDALTDQGFCRSTDGGANWAQVRIPEFSYVDDMGVGQQAPETILFYANGKTFRFFPHNNRCIELTGPENGVNALLSHPTDPRIWFGLYYLGVTRSTDGGDTWEYFNTGIESSILQTLAIDRTNPKRLFLGAKSGSNWHSNLNWGGVYRSDDLGASWHRQNLGLTIGHVSTLAIDPGDGNRVFAGTTGGGICRSTDGGTSWQAANTGVNNPRIKTVTINPHDPNLVLAATLDGVLRSTDGGASWHPANSGLAGIAVQSLAFDPNIPGRLYAGTDGGVVYRRERGARWQRLNSGFKGESCKFIEVHPAYPADVYLATRGGWVYRSQDQGAHWSLACPDLPPLNTMIALQPHPASAGLVIAGFSRGLAVTEDSGRSWLYRPATGTQPFTVFAVHPVDPSKILAGDPYTTFYRSTDQGVNWIDISQNPLYAVTAIAYYPLDPSIVFAAEGSEIFRSTDGGDSFSFISEVPTSYPNYIRHFVFDPGFAELIYAWSDGCCLFGSTDGGTSWVQLGADEDLQPTCVRADPLTSGILYVGTPSGLYRSADGGHTWNAIDEDLPSRSITSLAIDPADPGLLYAGTRGSLFKSTDTGATWRIQPDGLDIAGVRCLAVDPTDSTRVFAGTGGEGVLLSTDAGQTWTPRNTGPDNWVNDIQFHPSGNGDIWMGDWYSVRISHDRGESWDRLNLVPATAYQIILVPGVDWYFYIVGGDLYFVRPAYVDYSSILGDVSWAILDSTHPQSVYATNWQGVFFSEDGYRDWELLGGELELASCICQDLSNPNIFFVSRYPGVHRSGRQNAWWRPINGGLPRQEIDRVLIDPHDRATVYAAGPGGLYSLTIGSQDWNSDGVVDEADQAWLADGLSERSSSISQLYPVADLSIDGQVNIVDLLLAKHVAAGNLVW